VQRFGVPYDCVSIPGATWIWESNASTGGTFTYVRTFRLTDCALAALTSLKLSISADDCFSVVFNGHIIAPQGTGRWYYLSQYELKPLTLGSSATLGMQENVLEMTVPNTAGWGGLIYKLDLVV